MLINRKNDDYNERIRIILNTLDVKYKEMSSE